MLSATNPIPILSVSLQQPATREVYHRHDVRRLFTHILQASLGKHSLVGDEDLLKFRDVFRNLMNEHSELKVPPACLSNLLLVTDNITSANIIRLPLLILGKKMGINYSVCFSQYRAGISEPNTIAI